MISTQGRKRNRQSRSTTEQRERVLDRLRAQPGQMVEADTYADAWVMLGFDKEMTIGVFKSALSHLVHPVRSLGERQLVTHSRQQHLSRTKSSRPPHIWRALEEPRD